MELVVRGTVMVPRRTEFTAMLPTRKNGGKGKRRFVRLQYAKHGTSPSGRVYVTGREVGDGCCRHARSVYVEDITVVHRSTTSEHELDGRPPARTRRGR